MGKVTITANLGEGLYKVKKIYNPSTATALEKLAEQRADCESKLLLLRAAELDAIAEWVEAHNDLQNLIIDWQNNIVIKEEELIKPPQFSDKSWTYIKTETPKIKMPTAVVNAFTNAATKGKLQWLASWEVTQQQILLLSLIKRQTELTELKTIEELEFDVWCVDYITTLVAGDSLIGTLEIPGEVNPLIGGGMNIMPAFLQNAAWNNSYGALQLGKLMSIAGFAHAITLLTPWMKWMPLWRYATVTAIYPDNMDVVLDPIVSKVGAYLAKDTSMNEPWHERMTHVPVNYMSCGVGAFEVGDAVIVQFNRTSGPPNLAYDPVVIGFRDHPKGCRSIVFIPKSDTETLPPKRIVNPALPATNYQGSFPSYWGVFIGGTDWRGTNRMLLWGGAHPRYDRPDGLGIHIIENGAIVATSPRGILGAAYIMAVRQSDQTTIQVIICAAATSDTTLAIYMDNPDHPGAWLTLGETSVSWGTNVFFNPSGNQAAVVDTDLNLWIISINTEGRTFTCAKQTTSGGQTLYQWSSFNTQEDPDDVVWKCGFSSSTTGSSSAVLAADYKSDGTLIIVSVTGTISESSSGSGGNDPYSSDTTTTSQIRNHALQVTGPSHIMSSLSGFVTQFTETQVLTSSTGSLSYSYRTWSASIIDMDLRSDSILYRTSETITTKTATDSRYNWFEIITNETVNEGFYFSSPAYSDTLYSGSRSSATAGTYPKSNGYWENGGGSVTEEWQVTYPMSPSTTSGMRCVDNLAFANVNLEELGSMEGRPAWAYFLGGGNPVIATGLTGDNPRFIDMFIG